MTASDPHSMDVIWLLVCVALVLLMQGGFCCLESGLVRAKNSINVAIKNLIDFCVAGLVFWVFGYAIMFGTSWNGVIGTSGFLFDAGGAPWATAFFLFQLVFCGATATIIAGAVAERMRFSGYVLVTLVVSAMIYPVIGHWAWGGVASGEASGWLARLGFIDFAGSTVVHSTGGWVALAAVLILGPRLGRFRADGVAIQGHNIPLAMLGVVLLWVGWLGFNGGSTLGVSDSIATIVFNTILAGMAGGVASLSISTLLTRRPDVGHAMNGALAGLVGITASCHIMTPPAAVLIGCLAGGLSVVATQLLERLRIDDAIGAVPVHLVGGVFGTLAIPMLADPALFGTGLGRGGQLLVQLEGVVAVGAWAFGGGYVVLRLLNMVLPLRTSEDAERMGLNMAEHGASTAVTDLLMVMENQRRAGTFEQHVPIEPHTEIGQIAAQYNRVLDAVVEERQDRESVLSALAVSEELNRVVVESALDAVLTLDADGTITGWNAQATATFGYSLRDARHMNFVNTLIIEPLREGVSDDLHAFVDEGAEGMYINRRNEMVALHRDGGRFPVEMAIAPVRVDDSVMFSVFIRDITERQRTVAELERARDSAEAADRAKSAFLANMSHEIRTPMTAILGYTDILLDDVADFKCPPHQIEALRTISRNGEHLLAIINDILDVSKIEAGHVVMEAIECQTLDLLTDVLSLLQVKAATKSLHLSAEITSEIPETIITDPTRVQQVLTNLVGNAVKFTDVGGVRIEASMKTTPDDEVYMVFAIVDTGIGMSSHQQTLIFDAFAQADESTTRQFGGTGLGLSISRQLARMLGGDIEVASVKDTGSTFTFTVRIDCRPEVTMLPAGTPCISGERIENSMVADGIQTPITDEAPTPEPEQATPVTATPNPEPEQVSDPTPTTPTPEATAPSSGKIRVLVAEDGPDNQKLLRFHLTKGGFDVTIVENGQLALDAALEGEATGAAFDVIIMDMQMPVLDGYSATGKLREAGFTKPIIALTAHAMPGDRAKCLDAGCSDYTTKPINRQDLIGRINAGLVAEV